MTVTIQSQTSCAGQDPTRDARRPLAVGGSGHIVLTATGAQGVAPSLATFERATAVGADWISVEVRNTADGHPVLLRCSELRGVSDASLRYPGRSAICVEDLTRDEVSQLSIWLGRNTSARVTELPDLLGGLRSDAGLVLDLPIGPRVTGLDHVVEGHLRQAAEHRPIAVRSRDIDALGRIRAAVPGVTTLARLGASAARYSLGLLPGHIDGVSLPSGHVDDDLVVEASSRRLWVTAEAPSTVAEARRVLDLDVLALELHDDSMLTSIR